MLSEAEGCAVLKQVFTARGYTIADNVALDEGGVRFHADGWDAGARVGFEYLTHLAGDHAELASAVMAGLGAHIAAGKLFLFVIDETDIATAEELGEAAGKFLDEVARRRGAGGPA
jgi:hypothetical protein